MNKRGYPLFCIGTCGKEVIGNRLYNVRSKFVHVGDVQQAAGVTPRESFRKEIVVCDADSVN